MLHYTSVNWHPSSQTHISVMWILSCSETNSKEFLNTIIWKKCIWIFNSSLNAPVSECSASCSCIQHFKSKDQAVSITKHRTKNDRKFSVNKWIFFLHNHNAEGVFSNKGLSQVKQSLFYKSQCTALCSQRYFCMHRFNTDQMSSIY